MSSGTGDEALVAEALRWGVSRLSSRLRAASTDDSGLTRVAVSILANVKADGPSTATHLAGIEGLQRQSLTRVLNDLEAAGRIVRSRSATDGREQDIAITAAGLAALEVHVRSGNEWLAGALAELSGAERAVLSIAADLLQQIAATSVPPEQRNGAPPPL